MKNLVLAIAVFTASTFAYAAVPCTQEIKEKAAAVAAKDGLTECHIGQPKLAAAMPESKQLSRLGSITAVCFHFISQVSRVSVIETYSFTVVPPNCSTANVFANEQEQPE
jgi:hypothetical protein